MRAASSTGNLSRASIEDTFTRLLRLGRADAGRSFGPSIARSRLMQESEQALYRAARSGPPQHQLIAGRILFCPAIYSLWESQHLGLLGRIADQPHRGRQASTTLSNTFRLIYSSSLFDYLRASRARHTRRRRLVAHFHGDSGFVQALISVHNNYLRNAASLLCLKHIGGQLLEHSAFGEPLDDYERQFHQYFQAYCQWVVPDHPDRGVDMMNALQQELKIGVLATRQRLLAMPLQARAGQ
jgi:hypothetical protein